MFLNVCEQTLHISEVRLSQKVKGVLIKILTHYFHMKAKILADFQICMSVPLKHSKKLVKTNGRMIIVDHIITIFL